MSIIKGEPAICPNCGAEQNFTLVISWNKLIDPEYPANNKCSHCGRELKRDDIDISKCSPFYKRFLEIEKEIGV